MFYLYLIALLTSIFNERKESGKVGWYILDSTSLLLLFCWTLLVGVENQSLIVNFEREEAAQLKNLEHRKGKYCHFYIRSYNLAGFGLAVPTQDQ